MSRARTCRYAEGRGENTGRRTRAAHIVIEKPPHARMHARTRVCSLWRAIVAVTTREDSTACLVEENGQHDVDEHEEDEEHVGHKEGCDAGVIFYPLFVEHGAGNVRGPAIACHLRARIKTRMGAAGLVAC
jgi:hypothetical protein